MILSDFRDLVWQSAAREGTPYIAFEEVAKLNDLIQRRLNVYASATECLQSDNVAFTPIVGQRTYTTFNNTTNLANQDDGHGGYTTLLALPMCNVEQVFLNGNPLFVANDPGGRYGESSELQVAWISPGYLTAANGMPAYWFQKPPNTICFDRPFDQAYSHCWFQGRLYHSLLTGQDTQVLDLGPEDIEIAAQDASIELLRPLNRALAVELHNVLWGPKGDIVRRKGECSTKAVGFGQRTTGMRTEVVDLSC